MMKGFKPNGGCGLSPQEKQVLVSNGRNGTYISTFVSALARNSGAYAVRPLDSAERDGEGTRITGQEKMDNGFSYLEFWNNQAEEDRRAPLVKFFNDMSGVSE